MTRCGDIAILNLPNERS